MGFSHVSLETVEVERQGDAVIEVGTFELSGDGGRLMDRGKYVVIWKMQDGTWKLHRDIWNSSLAPQEN